MLTYCKYGDFEEVRREKDGEKSGVGRFTSEKKGAALSYKGLRNSGVSGIANAKRGVAILRH
jgi:uncharacterized membrane protein